MELVYLSGMKKLVLILILFISISCSNEKLQGNFKLVELGGDSTFVLDNHYFLFNDNEFEEYLLLENNKKNTLKSHTIKYGYNSFSFERNDTIFGFKYKAVNDTLTLTSEVNGFEFTLIKSN